MPHVIPVVIASAGALSLAVIGLQSEEDPSGPSAAAVAMSLGFSPQSCAIAGLTAPEAADGLGLLDSASTLRIQHDEAVAALDAAMTRYTLAKQAVQRGLRDDEHSAALVTAEAALASARADFEDSQEVLSALLSSVCDDENLERFGNYAASAGFAVPDEYRVLGYSEEAWEVVATAHRQQLRIEAGVFDAEDADLSAIVALDTNADVIAARSRLDEQHDDIESVFTGFESDS